MTCMFELQLLGIAEFASRQGEIDHSMQPSRIK